MTKPASDELIKLSLEIPQSLTQVAIANGKDKEDAQDKTKNAQDWQAICFFALTILLLTSVLFENMLVPDANSTVEEPSTTVVAGNPPDSEPSTEIEIEIVIEDELSEDKPSENELSEADAKALLEGWQAYKKDLFGPSYDRSRVSEFLDREGSASRKNISGYFEADDDSQLENLAWLEWHGFYYVYSQQQLRITKVSTTGAFATVETCITERRTIHKHGLPDPHDPHSNPGLAEETVRYILKKEADTWKISSYTVL